MTQLLQRWQRDTWFIPFQVTNATSGAAIDLTGLTICADLYVSGQGSAWSIAFASTVVQVTDAVHGKFMVTIPSTITAGVPEDASAQPNPDPTRLKVFYFDQQNRRQTFGVVFFEVFDGSETTLEIDDSGGVQIVYQDAQVMLSMIGGLTYNATTVYQFKKALNAYAAGSTASFLAFTRSVNGAGSNAQEVLEATYAPSGGDFEIAVLAWLQGSSSQNPPGLGQPVLQAQQTLATLRASAAAQTL